MSSLFTRSTISFIVNETLGITIVLHELIWRDGERPFFLVLAGALMGLPFVLAADGWKVRQQPGSKEAEDDRWSHLP